jgi:glycogen debranching enzyme
MGHLLASGLLTDEECEQVAARLVAPDLASGWGLRTMSADNVGYNPLSYHGGSVWPHDTAIAVWGLASRGQHEAATRLLVDLASAATRFGYRLPELFGGHARTDAVVPVPYPTACRPQAWAAGGGLLLLRSCLGLHPALPDGRLRITPLWPPPFADLAVERLPIGDRHLSLRISADAGIVVEVDGPPLEVEIQHPPLPSAR